MTSLAVLVETSACAWGKFALESCDPHQTNSSLSTLIRSIVAFGNSHLSLSANNRLLLYAYGRGIKDKLLYDSLHSDSPDSSLSIASSFRSALRTSCSSEDISVPPHLAATLSLAICRLRKCGTQSASDAATVRVPSKILILSFTPTFGSDHSILMNLFFSANKLDIRVDVVSLGGPSALLGQAADITSGVFLEVREPQHLASVLMTKFLFPSQSEDEHATVDYRAACFCHQNLVDLGWVCSVCLTVLCQFMPICPACNSVFKITVVPRRKKRKAE